MSAFDITNIAFVGIRKLVNTDHTIRSMVKLSFTGHAADKINMRSLRNMKKEITNPVGENPDHRQTDRDIQTQTDTDRHR